MSDPRLRIGITCYPSVGGSGILATALGVELAERGHEVHFISYERPFRLPTDHRLIHFHEVKINDYGLFRYPDYTLPLSVKMAGSLAMKCPMKTGLSRFSKLETQGASEGLTITGAGEF